MKSYRLLFPVAFLFLLGFSFCKKINEATDLGGDVIPVVDNIRTFEVALASETDNLLFDDSTRAIIGDQFALGHINDPVFGQTFADIYFNVSQGPAFNGVYPFINKDSVWVDSVILSLAYTSPYGDTNSMQTVSVHEIAPGSGFADSNYYYSGTRQASFPTTGAVLGTKTFTISQLNDTISHIRRRDTTKLVNVLRIPLPNSLGERITAFDTAKTANGGFYDDSLFKTLFKGFKVQSESSTGNGGLAYFNVGASET
ncbi:MAG TPA: DUF4270 family protein, partial [Flavisolibacter sp.]